MKLTVSLQDKENSVREPCEVPESLLRGIMAFDIVSALVGTLPLW